MAMKHQTWGAFFGREFTESTVDESAIHMFVTASLNNTMGVIFSSMHDVILPRIAEIGSIKNINHSFISVRDQEIAEEAMAIHAIIFE